MFRFYNVALYVTWRRMFGLLVSNLKQKHRFPGIVLRCNGAYECQEFTNTLQSTILDSFTLIK